MPDSRLVAALLGLTLTLPLSATYAQTPKPTPAPTADPNTDSTKVLKRVSLDTVKQDTLSRLKDRTVKTRGIISNFIGNRQRYRFTTADGAAVEVVGQFPETAGATYDLTARVIYNGNRYELTEVKKEPFGAANGESKATDPTLAVGIGLLVLGAAGGGFALMRSSQQKNQAMLQRRIADAERTAAEARDEAAKQVREALAAQAPKKGDAATIVGGGGGAPAGTLVSVGSLLIEKGPHAGQNFPLVAGENRIGRKGEGNTQIVLDKDREVSGAHGVLLVRADGSAALIDRSTNGSYLNGALVHHTEKPLADGATLTFGATEARLTLRRAGSPVAPPAAAAPVGRNAQTVVTPAVSAAPAPAPAAATPSRAAETTIGFPGELVIEEGEDKGKRFSMTRQTMTIGREDTDIILTDATISRQHGKITYVDNGFTYSDSGSRFGSKINNEDVTTEQRLKSGDLLQLGETTRARFVGKSAAG